MKMVFFFEYLKNAQCQWMTLGISYIMKNKEGDELMEIVQFKATDKQLYQQNNQLRDKVLRRPIGKNLNKENLTIEQTNDFFAIVEANNMLATLSIYFESKTVAHLTAFAVEPDYQNQGLGSMLVQYVVMILKEQKMSQIKVSARSTALNFYKKNGFHVIGEKQYNEKLGIYDYSMVLILS